VVAAANCCDTDRKLRSPVIDLTGVAEATLSFAYSVESTSPAHRIQKTAAERNIGKAARRARLVQSDHEGVKPLLLNGQSLWIKFPRFQEYDRSI
jgi:hypothetical protein